MIFYDEEIAKIDKYTEDKLYRVEKDFPIEGIIFRDITTGLKDAETMKVMVD